MYLLVSEQYIDSIMDDATINILNLILLTAIIFRYITNKMQRYTFYLFLETPLHVSAGISIHHQEHTQLHLQHLVLVIPLLLPTAITELQLLHDSGR